MRRTLITAIMIATLAVGASAASAAPADASLHAATTVTTVKRVAEVIDGDTVRLANGARVRLIGFDTPERGQCGYTSATAKLTRMVEGKKVTVINPASVKDRDAYGRALRTIKVGTTDVGAAQIRSGYANARYDSVDGYQWHPRQKTYRALDRQTAHKCGTAVDRKGEPAKTSGSGTSTDSISIPSGWYTDATYPGYTGCRQGYPGGKINGVYVWKPISC
ncbi:thermonuclease family protein [Demequina silvatica]|uniref:thermonuclease family protein n=1 Tax=Demequina silvatica TaxID=1638988 RepID=UPI0007857AEA|nr:thermonuclease family protein [Demequina silvatica]